MKRTKLIFTAALALGLLFCVNDATAQQATKKVKNQNSETVASRTVTKVVAPQNIGAQSAVSQKFLKIKPKATQNTQKKAKPPVVKTKSRRY